jgi:hypothetical protein
MSLGGAGLSSLEEQEIAKARCAARLQTRGDGGGEKFQRLDSANLKVIDSNLTPAPNFKALTEDVM